MRRTLLTVLGLLILLPALVVGTVIVHLLLIRSTAPESFDDVRARLEEEIPPLMNEHRVPGVAIALVHRGDVAWIRGYGSADTTSDTPITAETVFQAGSVSKAVTAWGVMRLVQEGKVHLDAPVWRYLTRWRLPGSHFDPDGVTVRRLLSHTASLSVSGYLGYDPDVALPSLETELVGAPDAAEGDGEVLVVYPPGDQVHYSGGGYTVLQLLVEEVGGQSFADYMQLTVLHPLGMINSTFDPAPEVIQQAATPYGTDGGPLPHYRSLRRPPGAFTRRLRTSHGSWRPPCRAPPRHRAGAASLHRTPSMRCSRPRQTRPRGLDRSRSTRGALGTTWTRLCSSQAYAL